MMRLKKCYHCGCYFRCSEQAYPMCQHAESCVCVECMLELLKSFIHSSLVDRDAFVYFLQRLATCFPDKKDKIDKEVQKLLPNALVEIL